LAISLSTYYPPPRLSAQEESEDESEEEEDEEDDLASLAGTEATGDDQTGMTSSAPGTGMETPDTVDLRKKTVDRPLYQVRVRGSALVGTVNALCLKG
jgi:hypothetical protein